MSEVLDHDLEPKELVNLRTRLERIASEKENPAFAQLAIQLIEFLDSDELRVAPERMTIVERLGAWWVTVENRWMSAARHRAAVIGGLTAVGTIAVIQAAQILFGDPERLVAELSDLVLVGRVGSSTGAALFSLQVVLEGVVGVLILAGAVLTLLDRDRLGTTLAFVGLLLSLVVVNLLTFYFEQFSTIIAAIVQFVLLIGVIRYRQRFLA